MKPDIDETNEMSEREIDRTIEDSFPASDPPSWTLGTDHTSLTVEVSDEDDGKEDR